MDKLLGGLKLTETAGRALREAVTAGSTEGRGRACSDLLRTLRRGGADATALTDVDVALYLAGEASGLEGPILAHPAKEAMWPEFDGCGTLYGVAWALCERLLLSHTLDVTTLRVVYHHMEIMQVAAAADGFPCDWGRSDCYGWSAAWWWGGGLIVPQRLPFEGEIDLPHEGSLDPAPQYIRWLAPPAWTGPHPTHAPLLVALWHHGWATNANEALVLRATALWETFRGPLVAHWNRAWEGRYVATAPSLCGKWWRPQVSTPKAAEIDGMWRVTADLEARSQRGVRVDLRVMGAGETLRLASADLCDRMRHALEQVWAVRGVRARGTKRQLVIRSHDGAVIGRVDPTKTLEFTMEARERR